MKITAYQTKLLTANDNLSQALVAALPPLLPEKTFVVVASKAFSTTENRFVAKVESDPLQKQKLVEQEADLYTEPHSSKYNLMLTIKRNWMFMTAGIDESNANNHYILWPEDPQRSVNNLWQFLRSHYGVSELGVIMTDSSSIPFNWGVIGQGIAHCGFNPLRSYIGEPDLFGKPFKMEQLNTMQCVAAAAVVEMGEGNERSPVALATELPSWVEFHDHAPTETELAALRIELEDDAYEPLLRTVPWKKGGGGIKL